MAGIYIHIPFCEKACNYCNFHFSTQLKNSDNVINAICEEIFLRKNDSKEKIDTIYFGGGTPGILSINNLEKIINTIKKNYILNANLEITLEANPDNLTKNSLEAWYKIGFNRLSIGVQSFDDEALVWMNRNHNTEQTNIALEAVKNSNINNFSCDIIYGLPQPYNDSWLSDIEKILTFNPTHLSCYALTVEPKTVLYNQIIKNKMNDVNTDIQASQFYAISKFLIAKGFNHYEISNFSLPTFESKHNSSYWEGKTYLGFGPAAHSFDGNKKRRWNIANNNLYTINIENKLPIFEQEILTDINCMNENIMIQLRRSTGIQITDFKTKFGEENWLILKNNIENGTYKNDLFITNTQISILPDARFLADGIAAELFF